jgi:hypothetical protein
MLLMSRTSVSVGLLLLVVCAGCLSPQSPSTPASSPTTDDLTTTTTPTGTSETDTSPVTTGYATECPHYLQVDVASDSQLSRTDEVLDYSELPPARQREFEAALTNGSVELGDALPDTWGSPLIVTYQGEQYYTVAYAC